MFFMIDKKKVKMMRKKNAEQCGGSTSTDAFLMPCDYTRKNLFKLI